jgi:uncharacterized protein
MNKFIRKPAVYFRYFYKTLFKNKSNSHEIAFGFGIGTFVGIFPTFGLGLIVLGLIRCFLKFNLPSSIAGTFIANPIIEPFWIYLSYLIGNIIYKPKFSEAFINNNKILAYIFSTSLNYIIGNIIISVLVSIISYYLLKFIIEWYRIRKKTKTNNVKKHRIY